MKNLIQKLAVTVLGLTALSLTASIFTGPPTTSSSGGSGTNGIPTLNGNGTNTALVNPSFSSVTRANTQTIGVFQMSPAGGNDPFADEQAATPNFADQLGFSAYGSQLQYMWWATGTNQSNWSGNFSFPGRIVVGDPTHMLTNDIEENQFVVNGVPDPSALATPSDNVISVRNMNTQHFSAIRYLDQTGQEQGAVGWGNSSASIFNSILYLESFGGGHGFYFTTAVGGISFGMEKTTTDLVCLYPGQQTDGFNATNVMFRVVHNTGAVSNYGNMTVGKLIFAGSGAQQITLAAGSLNASAFDATQTGTVNHDAMTIDGRAFVGNNPTLTKVTYDFYGNGTGWASTNSDFSIHGMIGGVEVAKFSTTQWDVKVPTLSASNLVVTNVITTPSIASIGGTGLSISGGASIAMSAGSITMAGPVTASTLISTPIANVGALAVTNSPAYVFATNIEAAISATTNYAVNFNVAGNMIVMATVGNDINFLYATNFTGNVTNYQEHVYLILGDGTHKLSFRVPAGESNTLETAITTNGVVPTANVLSRVIVSHVVAYGVTNTTYAFTDPSRASSGGSATFTNATSSVTGVVQVDGTTITANGSGLITAVTGTNVANVLTNDSRSVSLTGAVAVNGITAQSIRSTNYTEQSIGTLAASSTTNFVIDFHNPDVESVTLTGNANLVQTTNRVASTENKHIIWLYPNGTNRTVTFNSSWHTNGFSSTTITLTNSTIMSVVFACNGSAETNVFAVANVWP